MIDTKKLWEKATVEIELEVSKANFSTWFRHAHIARIDDGLVYVSVPNPFVKDWLRDRFHKLILRSLRNCTEGIRGVEYLIQKPEDRGKEVKGGAGETELFDNQLRMPEVYINQDDNLNPRYTFDTFIVGSFNELAHAAAQAVVKSPGAVYNPLFIYGQTGLGKTHLIQAIGNYFKKVGNRRAYYLTSERYTNEYVNAVIKQKIPFFKERYNKYDILIIDDIQFLSEKDKTQEELFHLFNYFHENNKQIVFSSDKPPKHIPKIEDRLRSRFEGGMIVDIQAPDFESRLAILQSKLRSAPFAIDRELMEYLANTIQDNIRELEGALNTIVLQSQLKKRGLSVIEVKALIKNSMRPQRSLSVKDVIRTVANFYNIEEQMIYEKTRRKDIVKPRQIAMYILREDFATSYPSIGEKLGGRDHTTVIHAYEKIKRDLKVDTLLSQEMDQIKTLLYRSGVGSGMIMESSIAATAGATLTPR